MSDCLERKVQISAVATGKITGAAWHYGTVDRIGDMIEKGAFAFQEPCRSSTRARYTPSSVRALSAA